MSSLFNQAEMRIVSDVPNIIMWIVSLPSQYSHLKGIASGNVQNMKSEQFCTDYIIGAIPASDT